MDDLQRAVLEMFRIWCDDDGDIAGEEFGGWLVLAAMKTGAYEQVNAEREAGRDILAGAESLLRARE